MGRVSIKSRNSKYLKNIATFYKKINYDFKNEDILVNALKHRSYLHDSNEKREASNERLEFLGDSILTFIVNKFLYLNFPSADEGEMSKKKSIIVSGTNLSRLAKSIRLGAYLILSDSEKKSGGSKKDSILEDAFEALIGAIYLDGGMRKVEAFIKTFVIDKIDEALSNKKILNYKSELLELVQAHGSKPPKYKIISSIGPEHEKIFTIVVIVDDKEVVTGKEKSKKKAEQIASKKALTIFKRKFNSQK